MPFSDLLRPSALDEGQDGDDFPIREHAVIGGHIRRIAWIIQQALKSELRQPKQHGVVMVPGMSGLVMRRRRQFSVGPPSPPVRLAFQLSAVAARALIRVDLPPERNERGVVPVEECLENAQSMS